MIKAKFIFFILVQVLVVYHKGYAQLNPLQIKEIDSLKNLIKSTKNDTIRINAWVKWDDIIYITDPETDLLLNQKISNLCKIKLKNKLNKSEKKFYLKRNGAALNNIGIIFEDKGNFPEALKNYYAALKIFEEINDKKGLANAYNNIGVINRTQGNYEVALSNLKDALKLYDEIGQKRSVALAYNNIGNLYMDAKDFKLALESFKMALKIREEIGDVKGIADSEGSIGNLYFNQQNFNEAKKYYNKAIINEKKVGDKFGLASSKMNLGICAYRTFNYDLARKYYNEVIQEAKSLNVKSLLKTAYKSMARLDSLESNYKAAFTNYKLYIIYRDSLFNEDNTKRTIQARIEHEFDKKAAADSVKFAEERKMKDIKIAQQKAISEKKDAELANKRTQQYALFGGLILVLVFAIFIYNRFRITQKQKTIIEQKERETHLQKEIIEEKQKEIIDSIRYAKRIQQALLPSNKYISKVIGKLKKD